MPFTANFVVPRIVRPCPQVSSLPWTQRTSEGELWSIGEAEGRDELTGGTQMTPGHPHSSLGQLETDSTPPGSLSVRMETTSALIECLCQRKLFLNKIFKVPF